MKFTGGSWEFTDASEKKRSKKHPLWFTKKVFSTKTDGIFHPFQSGIIYRIIDSVVMVAANSGTLGINKILNEKGENIISILKVGDRLYTPREKIEKALQYRAIYTPDGLKKQ